jgi:hypothetical protein
MSKTTAVLDCVNKYRHGVLIGNFVEDKFGLDLIEKVSFPIIRAQLKMQLNYVPLKIITIWIILFTKEMK